MLHTIKNDVLTVIAAEQGAELQSIMGADGTEYLWQGDSVYWSDRALNIFPYVARLTEGSYRMDGKLYHMDIHGIAPYSRFSPVEHNSKRLALELVANEKTLVSYPREFVFRIIYELAGSTLHITYEVENRDIRTMYFGLGGHPGFNVPLAEGLRFEDYRLRFNQLCSPLQIGFTEDCFLNGDDIPFPLDSGQIISLRHSLFNADAIVLKGMDRQITLETPSDTHSITITFPQMPYLGIWHSPKSDAPYVCIEPWCSLPAKQGQITVFEEQADLLKLPPGDTYRNCWSIAVNC